VFTGNVAVVAPAGTVTLGGTLAARCCSRAPLARHLWSCPLNVTVPVEEFPLQQLAGFSESEEREEEAGTEDSSNSRIAGLGSFCETATNFVAEII